MTLKGISVVLPAYNEEKFLPATLKAIQKSRERFASSNSLPTEIIVVNNASTDKTEEVALSFGSRVVNHPIRNISSVRNAGINSATFDLIIMIDADSFLPEDALTKVFDVMASGKILGGAFGVKVLTEKLSMKILAFIIQSVVTQVSGMSGAMFFFQKDAALKIGGFREDRLIAEDSAFAMALSALAKKDKKRFIRFPSVQVGTLDRKEMTPRLLGSILLQILQAITGRKQKSEDLTYWYDPKR